MYQKTDWKDRIVQRPLTYTMQQNADGTVTLIPSPGTVTQQGTPVNAALLNKIEDGLVEATAQLATKAAKETVDLIQQFVNQIQELKADISYVDTVISNLLDGSIKGTYTTLNALKSAYPQGTPGVFLVIESGHIYYWNETEWTDAGQYQGIEVGDGTITFRKLGVTFLRGDIIGGIINVDLVAKTVSTTSATMTTNTSNRTIPAMTITYTGSVINIFYNLSTQKIETYPIADLSGATTTHNHLVLLATLYNGKLYNLITKDNWTINGVPFYVPVFSQQNVLFTSGTSYGGYTGILDVQFDEANKTITFPKNGCIVRGNKMDILSNDVVLTINKTDFPFTYRVLVLYDTTTSTIYLRYISGSGHIPKENDLMLGSFLLEWEGTEVNFKYIQGCFPFTCISRKGVTISIPSVWNGKIVNFIGDSITYGSYGNFITTVKDILGLSNARNYGIGGSRLCKVDETLDSQYPPVVSRYMNMDTAADAIFMLIGTNDYSSQVPLGATNSTSEYEFNGALNIVLDGLRTMYPDKLIIVSTILHRYNANSLPIKLSEYNAAIRERCDAKHILVCDLYSTSGFDFTKGYYDKILTGDGLHPNEKGAEILGRKIAGFINVN